MRWLICPPEIPQLHVNFAMRRIMERPWIVHSLLVPAFDFVCNYGSFFQTKSVEDYRDLCGHGRAGQSFIGNRADDFMSQGAVRLRRSGGPEDGRNCQEQTTARRGFHFWTSGYGIEFCPVGRAGA